METKVCPVCKIENNKLDFHKRSARPSGVISACKDCRQSQTKQYYEDNTNKIILASCKYQKENPEKTLKNHQSWIKGNQDSVKQNATTWRQKNPQKYIEN
jgi:hypothetical protein